MFYSGRGIVNRRMRDGILFSALGGAQSIGASCYFLRLGDANILLDCGTGYHDGVSYMPRLEQLLDSGVIDSYDSVSEVFISHAHMDHIGGLHNFMAAASGPDVYMTAVTKKLYAIQSFAHLKVSYDFLSDILQHKCREVSFMEKIKFRSYSVTFLPAGHIPGAMMCLFEYKGRKILYTGDYSLKSTAVAQGCFVPCKDIDTLIICGLHAKHSSLDSQNDISIFMRNIGKILFDCTNSVWIRTKFFNKSIEVLAFLSRYLPDNGIKIYVKDSILNMVSDIETLGIRICDSRIVPLSRLSRNCTVQHIVVSDSWCHQRQQYVSVDCDFTLHDTFKETLGFIKELNPKNTVIVHSSPFRSHYDCSVEDILVRDADFNGRIYFPEENDLLIL